VLFESSLPKLLYGNNLAKVVTPTEALSVLREFLTDYVDGEFPDLGDAEYLRVDYCHKVAVANALPDYVATLANISFLKHHRLTDGYGGVEYWNESRRVRIYDKYKEIMEVDKKNIPEARGILRFEVQLRKKSQYLQRRLKEKTLSLNHVLQPQVAYACLAEALNNVFGSEIFAAGCRTRSS
jgi:Phage replication protein CRI